MSLTNIFHQHDEVSLMQMLNDLPSEWHRSGVIRFNDEGAFGQDPNRNLILKTFGNAGRSTATCIACNEELNIYDRFPLINGIFFLSNQMYTLTQGQKTQDARHKFIGLKISPTMWNNYLVNSNLIAANGGHAISIKKKSQKSSHQSTNANTQNLLMERNEILQKVLRTISITMSPGTYKSAKKFMIQLGTMKEMNQKMCIYAVCIKCLWKLVNIPKNKHLYETNNLKEKEEAKKFTMCQYCNCRLLLRLPSVVIGTVYTYDIFATSLNCCDRKFRCKQCGTDLSTLSLIIFSQKKLKHLNQSSNSSSISHCSSSTSLSSNGSNRSINEILNDQTSPSSSSSSISSSLQMGGRSQLTNSLSNFDYKIIDKVESLDILSAFSDYYCCPYCHHMAQLLLDCEQMLFPWQSKITECNSTVNWTYKSPTFFHKQSSQYPSEIQSSYNSDVNSGFYYHQQQQQQHPNHHHHHHGNQMNVQKGFVRPTQAQSCQIFSRLTTSPIKDSHYHPFTSSNEENTSELFQSKFSEPNSFFERNRNLTSIYEQCSSSNNSAAFTSRNSLSSSNQNHERSILFSQQQQQQQQQQQLLSKQQMTNENSRMAFSLDSGNLSSSSDVPNTSFINDFNVQTRLHRMSSTTTNPIRSLHSVDHESLRRLKLQPQRGYHHSFNHPPNYIRQQHYPYSGGFNGGGSPSVRSPMNLINRSNCLNYPEQNSSNSSSVAFMRDTQQQFIRNNPYQRDSYDAQQYQRNSTMHSNNSSAFGSSDSINYGMNSNSSSFGERAQFQQSLTDTHHPTSKASANIHRWMNHQTNPSEISIEQRDPLQSQIYSEDVEFMRDSFSKFHFDDRSDHSPHNSYR
ncbi:hypothetical protein SNEBB_011245 [Seison nebaliae]|nr:hypothetical protein SNEBB_011245 [Seison nebaliae]